MNCRTRFLPPSRIMLLCCMTCLLVIALYIRLHGTERFYYNPDEAMHASIAQGRDLTQVVAFAHDEIHPPLSYMLYHYWMKISDAPGFVRGMSLFFALLLLPVYYGIGKRLDGPFTGLCCATFVAFGNGCIIQSYVVRQYAVFLFFISVAFYTYLRWRERKTTPLLLLYGLCALLACMSHFSAIFDVFCIAVFELSRFGKNKSAWRGLSGWIAVNAVIGMAALYVYHLWQPILVPLQSYFVTHVGGSVATIAMHTLFYPIASPGYILPDYAMALLLLAGMVGFAITKPRFVQDIHGLRSLLRLNLLAFALGMILVATRIYPEPGTRHSIWLTPFVIPAAGWMLAELLRAGLCALPAPERFAFPTGAFILLAGGCLLYSAEQRFKDGSEYVWPNTEWRKFLGAMQALGPDDLIVTEKDDGIMLANLYRNMGQDAFTGKHMAAVAPYGKSAGILFNPYYPRNYSTGVLLATLREAEARHMLDGARNLVFLRMAWSRSPLTDLMLCEALPRNLVAIPPFMPGFKPNDMDIFSRYAVWMRLPKQTVLEEILPDHGKAHACLSGAHDKVPNLVPVSAGH